MPEGLVDAGDLEQFESGDPDFFVRAAEAEVRRYCGWHIAPSLVATNVRCRVGEMGTIMLRSLHVTSVESVVVDGRTLAFPDEYDWDPAGFITRRCPSWPRHHHAVVSFTHGYGETPVDVQAVVFELAAKARTLPVPLPAKDISGGPFRLGLTGAGLGVTLSDDQKDRLVSYRIQGIA